MTRIEYRLGKESIQHYSSKQKILAYLYKLPIISKYVKKALKKAYNLNTTVAVDPGFHCESAHLIVGEHTVSVQF